ncbi:MAG: hypothetical protein AB1782_05620 [Cyanobacteriota bacterium]
MVEVFDTIKQVKSNFAPYKQWEQKQSNIEAQRQQLHKTINTSPDQLKQAHLYGKAVVDAVNIMDRYSEDKAEDVEMATQSIMQFWVQILTMGSLAGYFFLNSRFPGVMNHYNGLFNKLAKIYPEKVANHASEMLKMMTFMVGTSIFGLIPSILYSNHLQKTASRIARFQARETELKDPKNFVIYDDKQFEQAQEKAKLIPEEKESRFKGLNPFGKDGPFSTIKSLLKDRKAYKEWKLKSETDEQVYKQLFNIPVNSEQIEKAKSHQEIIFNIIKKVDIASQEYSENVEVATSAFNSVVLGSSTIIGYLSHKAIGILEKVKGSAVSPLIKAIAPWGIALAMVIGLTSTTTKLQKEGARIGRFKAKKELLKDPHNFIHYTDQQMKTVGNINVEEDTSLKNKIKKLFNEVMFIFTALKDYKEYKNYKKTQEKEEIKLNKALKQVNVSPEQLAEATKLQEKVFRMFEKMDENSQRYQEDIEASAEIVTSFLGSFMAIGAGGITFKLLNKLTSNPKIRGALSIVVSMVSLLGLNAFVTKLEKKASKIGLMQAIKDLEDPRNFVDFTDEQKLQAQAFQGNNNFNNTQQKNQDNEALIDNLQQDNVNDQIVSIQNKTEFNNPTKTLNLNNTQYANTSTASLEIYNWLDKLKTQPYRSL